MYDKVSALIENSRTLENLAVDMRANYELQLKMRNDSDAGELVPHVLFIPMVNITFSFAETRAGIRREGAMERGE